MSLLPNITSYKIFKEIKYTASTVDSKIKCNEHELYGPPKEIIKVITKPLGFGSNNIIIPTTYKKFINISTDITTIDCYVYSDVPFYVKITKSEETNDFFVIKTSLFMYDNKDEPIKVSIANGTFEYDPITESFITAENTSPQQIYYINIE